MPPKTWQRGTEVAAPSLSPSRRTEALRSSPPEQRVESYVVRELTNNNLLGISSDEIKGAARQLATCATKKEVFEWCSTFMLDEAVAAEVVKQRDDQGPFFEGSAPRVASAVLSVSHQKTKRATKKSTSLSSLSSSAAKPLVPGVYFECGCFALSHPFQGNCHNCGRLFCMQESMDSCYHCGLDPARCIAYEIKVESGKIDEAAQQKNAAGYTTALEKRDQLLKYAREKSKRTAVIDDQSGVFLESNNAWASSAERNAAADKEASDRRKKIVSLHKSTGAYTVHLDIVNQNVALGARVEDVTAAEPTTNIAVEDPKEESSSSDDVDATPSEPGTNVGTRVISNPALLQKFWYVDSDAHAQKHSATHQSEAMSKPPTNRRIQDSCRLQNDYFEDDALQWESQRSLQTSAGNVAAGTLISTPPLGKIEFVVPAAPALVDAIDEPAATASTELVKQFEPEPANGVTKAMRTKDEGMCLSMHQPWASLLISGLKTHEGRTWSTDFRGKLWIHAASAKPTDISGTEARYARFCTKGKKFPQHYPTGCLLGYVFVTDCLDHASYVARFAEDEQQEDSPFKFICAEPRELPFPLPMEGKHKIFKLDRKVLVASKQQLNEK